MTPEPAQDRGACDGLEARREARMHKRVEKMEDGRAIIYYTFERPVEPEVSPQEPAGRCGEQGTEEAK